MRVSIIATLLLGGAAAAHADAYDALQKAVPAGWTVLHTEHELVIRHDRPCYVTGKHRDNDPVKSQANPCTDVADGPLVTLELRFHIEPRWTQQQLDDAKLANDRLAGELKTAREKYRIDAIQQSKGRPVPATADEKKRLAAYEKEEAQLAARTIHTPMCTLGDSSLFDGDQTYAQLKYKVDPPEAMTEAYKVLDVLKKQCAL